MIGHTANPSSIEDFEFQSFEIEKKVAQTWGLQSYDLRFRETGSDGCIGCHSSGLIPLRPISMLRQFLNEKEFLNREIRKNEIVIQADMPTVGISENLPLAVVNCFESFSDIDLSNSELKDAFSCKTCHDGKNRSGIVANHGLLERYIDSGIMPTNFEITKEARAAVIKCLRKTIPLEQ